MSERLTDQGLADVAARVDKGTCHNCEGTGNEQPWRTCRVCSGTGVFALSTETMMTIITELRSYRAAESQGVLAVINDDGQMHRVFVTGRELDSLRTLALMLNKHSHEPYAYEGEEMEEGVAVLARLVES